MREKWILWCGLNAEQECLEKLFNKKDFVSIRGNTINKKKIENEMLWRETDIPIMITKTAIFGQGLNWQVCHNMCFVGLSDSFEAMYQAIRRCYRFGQTHDVNVHIIISDKEGNVIDNIKRKEANAKIMLAKMVQHVSLNTIKALKSEQITDDDKTENFKLPMFL